MKVACITGINGQDGSYLAEYLLENDYKVYGMIRRVSVNNLYRLNDIVDRITLYYADITDLSSCIGLLSKIKRECPGMERLEIYNFAAQSFVQTSFDTPVYTTSTNSIGVINILEAIRISDLAEVTRFYQASTSEMYGKVHESPQNESTAFHPRSPYGCSKVFGHQITVNYREAYGMFNCCGILFNHESPRRGEEFVTRKITSSLAKLITGKISCIELGNLDAKRDWGHAKDYIRAVHLILQQDSPGDYVVSTGKEHSIREFLEKAFEYLDLKIQWKGTGVNEIGLVTFPGSETPRTVVKVSEKHFRPAEVDTLLGDSSKIKSIGWSPTVDFDFLVKEMVEFDLNKENKDLGLKF